MGRSRRSDLDPRRRTTRYTSATPTARRVASPARAGTTSRATRFSSRRNCRTSSRSETGEPGGVCVAVTGSGRRRARCVPRPACGRSGRPAGAPTRKSRMAPSSASDRRPASARCRWTAACGPPRTVGHRGRRWCRSSRGRAGRRGARRVPGRRRGDDGGDRRRVGHGDGAAGVPPPPPAATKAGAITCSAGVERRRRGRVGGGSARGRGWRLYGCRRGADTRTCRRRSPPSPSRSPAGRRNRSAVDPRSCRRPARSGGTRPVPPEVAGARPAPPGRWRRSHRRCPAPSPALAGVAGRRGRSPGHRRSPTASLAPPRWIRPRRARRRRRAGCARRRAVTVTSGEGEHSQRLRRCAGVPRVSPAVGFRKWSSLRCLSQVVALPLRVASHSRQVYDYLE